MECILKFGIVVFLIAIMYEDWKKQTIDPGLLLGLGIWTLALVLCQGGLRTNLLIGLTVFFCAFSVYYSAEKRKKPCLGGADPVLLGILALLFSTKVGWVVLLAGILVILHHVFLVLLKKRRWKETIPLGSYLSLTSIIFLVKAFF